jgi:hypothetical protein
MRLLVLLLLVVLACGCDLRQREESLKERERVVSEKEKQLTKYENIPGQNKSLRAAR